MRSEARCQCRLVLRDPSVTVGARSKPATKEPTTLSTSLSTTIHNRPTPTHNPIAPSTLQLLPTMNGSKSYSQTYPFFTNHVINHSYVFVFVFKGNPTITYMEQATTLLRPICTIPAINYNIIDTQLLFLFVLLFVFSLVFLF